MRTLDLYTRDGCTICTRAKKALGVLGIPYTEYVIGEQITRDDVLERWPSASKLPVVIMDGEYLGTWEDLVTWIQGGGDEQPV